MPRLTMKELQQDLQRDRLWPIYVAYGPEAFKKRWLLQTLRAQGVGATMERTLEGSLSMDSILDFLKTPCLWPGISLLVVQDAHLIKPVEMLPQRISVAQSFQEIKNIAVLFLKDWDARKKLNRWFLEHTAVLACEAVRESEKVAWVQFLAQRAEVTLDPLLLQWLCLGEPWWLDGVDQELQKIALFPQELRIQRQDQTALFLKAFLKKQTAQALQSLPHWVGQVDQMLPLLGLLNWHVRQLREGSLKNELLRECASLWTTFELRSLQQGLQHLDEALKQSAQDALGLWSQWVLRLTRSVA